LNTTTSGGPGSVIAGWPGHELGPADQGLLAGFAEASGAEWSLFCPAIGIAWDPGPLPVAALLRSPVGGGVATGAAMLAESAGGNQFAGVLAGAALESVCTVRTSGIGGFLSQAPSKSMASARTVKMKGACMVCLSLEKCGSMAGRSGFAG
jgi:hypothetical protein